MYLPRSLPSFAQVFFDMDNNAKETLFTVSYRAGQLYLFVFCLRSIRNIHNYTVVVARGSSKVEETTVVIETHKIKLKSQ